MPLCGHPRNCPKSQPFAPPGVLPSLQHHQPVWRIYDLWKRIVPVTADLAGKIIFVAIFLPIMILAFLELSEKISFREVVFLWLILLAGFGTTTVARISLPDPVFLPLGGKKYFGTEVSFFRHALPARSGRSPMGTDETGADLHRKCGDRFSTGAGDRGRGYPLLF